MEGILVVEDSPEEGIHHRVVGDTPAEGIHLAVEGIPEEDIQRMGIHGHHGQHPEQHELGRRTILCRCHHAPCPFRLPYFFSTDRL